MTLIPIHHHYLIGRSIWFNNILNQSSTPSIPLTFGHHLKLLLTYLCPSTSKNSITCFCCITFVHLHSTNLTSWLLKCSCVFLMYSNNQNGYFRRNIKGKFRLDYDSLDINLDYRNGDSQFRLDNQDESEMYLSGIIVYQNGEIT